MAEGAGQHAVAEAAGRGRHRARPAEPVRAASLRFGRPTPSSVPHE